MFNSTGAFVIGCGGPVSWNGVVVAAVGWSAQWLNDHTIIANVMMPEGMRLGTFDVSAPERGWTVIDNESNYLCGRADRWAAWAAGRGVFGTVGSRPSAGLSPVSTDQRGAAGPDGTIALVRDYQAQLGLVLVRSDGDELELPGVGYCRHVQVLAWNAAMWDGGAFNFDPGLCLDGAQRRRYAGGWLAYECSLGLVAHPVNRLDQGRLIVHVEPVQNFFHHEIVLLPDGRVLVGYSTTAGEGPDDARVVDVLTLPVVDLGQQEEPITPINRKMWLAFFTGAPGAAGGWDTDDDPPGTPEPPGNGRLDVPSSTFKDEQDRPIATFIHGGATVEEVEEKARHTPYTPVAYWDARVWGRSPQEQHLPPHWPDLPTDSWLGLQGYCHGDESLPAFEANMRSQLVALRAAHPQQKVSIVAQCFKQTPVNHLTDDLRGLVPIFSRLAVEFVNVVALNPFNGTGRRGGLQDHPEVRALWQQLADTIAGPPYEGEVTMEFPRDAWDAVVVPMHQRFAQQAIDEKPGQPDEQGRLWTSWLVQQMKFSYPSGGWCSKAGSPTSPPSKDALARQIEGRFEGWDMLLGAGANGPRDLANYPPGYHDLTGQYPITDLVPKNWLDQEEPEDMRVEIIDYDRVVRRSDPKGMLVRFDVTSPMPVVRIDLDLVEDDEPSIPILFTSELARDGRYVRALAFKPVRNGTWTLRVTAVDDQGRVVNAEGADPVTVTL